jgi:prepilin-type processing-associated H-X9-DG protein
VSKVKVLGPLQGQRMTTVVENGFARSNYVGVAGWDNDWHLGVKAKDNPNGAEGPDAKNWSKQELGHDFRDGTIIYGALKLRDNKPLPNARDFHGIFGENSNRKLGHVTDGTANTIVVGERATPTKSDTENDVGNAIWAGVPDRSTRVGQSLSLGTVYWPINHKLDAATVPNTTGFNSRHGAGANFLLCDGSARTVSENIDLALLRRLGIIDDGSTGEIDIPTAK